MEYVTCFRCGSRRLSTGVQCLDCWWTPLDWGQGRIQPVTNRLDYEQADGVIVRWVTYPDGRWHQQEVRD